MGTLNLCQKMSDKMQNDSGQSDHSIRRKRPKYGENWPFWNILDVFSRLDECMDLNPFASCHASSGTSLEYPHGVIWSKNLFSKVDSHAKSYLKTLIKKRNWHNRFFSLRWYFPGEKISFLA